jgi:hypothetical protein
LWDFGTVSVFSLETGTLFAQLSEHQIRDSVRAAQRSTNSFVEEEDKNSSEVIDMILVSSQVGGDVLSVLITRGGGRVYIKNQRSSSYLYAPGVNQLAIACVRVAPGLSDLRVSLAVSPDKGRTIVLACTNGLALFSLDESCVASKNKMREKISIIPVSGVKILSFQPLFVPPESLAPLAVSETLLQVTSDMLIGGFAQSWRLLALSAEKEIFLAPKTVSEQLVDVLRAKNLHSVRDWAIQWKPEQLSGVLLEILAGSEKLLKSEEFIETAEKILFSPETATALGLVDSPGLLSQLSASVPSNVGLLGVAVQTQASYVSSRCRGVAIFISRILRPVWFKKAFHIEYVQGRNSSLSVKSALSSSQRQSVCELVSPAIALLSRFRYQLGEAGESRIVEGFIVLVNAVVEAMELLRLFDTGQLANKRKEEQANSDAAGIKDLLVQMDNLLVRDLIVSSSDSSALISLLNRQGLDLQLAKKMCPLIVHEHI